MADISTLLGVTVWGALIGFVVLAAWHVWYAAGLARVLTANGGEGWRAWVPLLGDAEVLRLGRIDPVKVTLLLVPVVAIYGVVLRAIAAHRLGTSLGRGAGTTVLAVLLPPVWAMVLADAAPLDADAAERAAADDKAADDKAAVALAAVAAMPAVAAPAPQSPAAPAPPAVAPAVTRTAAPAAVAAPVPVPPAAVGPITAGLEAQVGATPDAAAPAAPVPNAAAALGDDAPAEATSLRRRSRNEPPADDANQPASDETSIAPGPRNWELVLPSGEVLPVTARTLILGRKPQTRRGAAQYVTVDDDSRTVSKEHAQLQWVDEGWSISDLGSVNGIALVGEAGAEARVAAGESARVTEGFLLGDARLQLRRTDGA